jgi:hypothetical protein
LALFWQLSGALGPLNQNMEELQVKPINTSYNLEKLQAISDRLLGSCFGSKQWFINLCHKVTN